MAEDGRNFVERRLTPRIRMTVRRHIQYWVAMSPARRVVASLSLAAVIGGITFGACRASDVTGPNFKSQQRSVSNTLLGATDPIVNNEDSDSWPMQPAGHMQMTPDEAEKDPGFQTSVETRFPVTHDIYNPCRGELVVLNGELRTRMRLDADPNGHLRYQLREFRDTRGISGSAQTVEQWDHDGNPITPPETRTTTVKYHNKDAYIDQFQVGPAVAPFRSELTNRIHLQRNGDDPYRNKEVGDDLFVFSHKVVKIGTSGQPVIQEQFRVECK